MHTKNFNLHQYSNKIESKLHYKTPDHKIYKANLNRNS